MSYHLKDSDCSINEETGLCTACGVLHGAPCFHCGARAYHKPGCIFLLRSHSPRVLNLQRNAAESLRTRRDPPVLVDGQPARTGLNDGPLLPRESAADQVPFSAVGVAVMRGSERWAVARSHNFAKRIAAALNEHKTNPGGW